LTIRVFWDVHTVQTAIDLPVDTAYRPRTLHSPSTELQ